MQIDQNRDYRWVVGFPNDPNSRGIEIGGQKFLAIPYSHHDHVREIGDALRTKPVSSLDDVEIPFEIRATAGSDWNGNGNLYIDASTVFTKADGNKIEVNGRSYLAENCKKPTPLRVKMLADNLDSVCSQLGLGHPYPMMLTTERSSLPILTTKAQIPSRLHDAYLIAIRGKEKILRR